MGEIRTTPVEGRSVWRGADVAADRSWEYRLDDAGRAVLLGALEAARARGLSLPEVTRETFPLPGLGGMLSGIAGELRAGRGFAMLRGFPVEGRALGDIELMYWGLCSHLGTGLSQNSDATLIHYVTEGRLRPNQGARGVGFPKESKLHIDLTDVVALLCVQQAPDDPPSRLASSMTVYNELLARRPDALARLYEGFEWDRMDEHGPDETATSGYRVPLFSARDGVVSCQYNRNWIEKALIRRGTILDDDDRALFDEIDAIAYETRFEFPFHAGDIQFANNYTVLHGRAAHAPVQDPERYRVLMRIWLDMDDMRPFADPALIRCGNSRHGQMGWTAAELRAGRNAAPRARRPDGAVVLA